MSGFAGRDFISINDFSNEQIEAVLDLADEMGSTLEKGKDLELCRRKDMATLFYEPSTRTRGSFERAMHKLGGTVLSFAEAGVNSSAVKGETLTDTVRVLENYADIIVLRHPLEGAAKVTADYASVPVINAGDGAHEHPTQTLCDLYTIRKNKGKIKGLTVCLMGDLRYGRTVHSLIYALARFGAEVLCWPPAQSVDMPETVLKKLLTEYNYVPKKVKTDEDKSIIGKLDVLYIAPVQPYTLPLWTEPERNSAAGFSIKEALGKTDVIYVTRLQTERRAQSPQNYIVLDKELLSEFKKKPLVMHPLPRMNELAYELDSYPKSVYFQQAAYGVPVRMALIALLLGATDIKLTERGRPFASQIAYEEYERAIGIQCPNSNCISNNEREKRYILPDFKMLRDEALTLRCVYCEQEVQPGYIASSEWHQGRLENKKYHRSDSHLAKKIKAKNLILFNSSSDAEAQGFKPSFYAQTRQMGKD
ncbi:aspartate carbamoyltransferase [Chloroflexota bacterium]